MKNDLNVFLPWILYLLAPLLLSRFALGGAGIGICIIFLGVLHCPLTKIDYNLAKKLTLAMNVIFVVIIIFRLIYPIF